MVLLLISVIQTGTRTGYLGTTGASDDMFLFTQASKPIRFLQMLQNAHV